ncbi:MAG: FAD-binding protein [Deltaproteobacteria bacterium]|nr:FAD-binding protein [Deltaproteobacteria bacterium]MBW2309285.1 FAD-binding protein [Deltaproteobacteria bacterium]
MENRYLETDILVIGGGSAGCLAANRVLEADPGLKVVIFEKGDIKYSGSIARGMDALNIVAIPDFTSPELYVKSSTLGCEGVLDAPPSYEMARRSFGLLKKLEGWGVYFPQDEKGNYRTLQYHPIGKFLTAMEEPDLKVIISTKAQEKGAMAVNRTMGLRLLMDDGRVAGAVGINVRTGELVICRAGAVILSSGGTARFGLPNSGYLYGTFDFPGNTGDGYVMGFMAGASLTGMEYSRRSMLIKDSNIPLLAITITRGGRMMDIFDNILMEWECHDHKKSSEAFAKGWGPLRIRLNHLPEETIQEIEDILFTTERPVQQRFFKGRNVDFRKGDIELWPTEHQLCGGHGMSGLVVNERAETGVPGLYAAGDVACVAKGHLTGAFVFGEIAAEQAARFVRSNPRPGRDSAQVDDVQKARDHRLSHADKLIDVRDLEYKMRRLINDYVISPKNAYKLNRWLEWAKRFEHEIENDTAVSNGHDLSKLYEVENILKCATFSAAAALERRESRWGNAHHRTDYPERDDQNWLCHVDIRRGEYPDEMTVARRPLNQHLPT